VRSESTKIKADPMYPISRWTDENRPMRSRSAIGRYVGLILELYFGLSSRTVPIQFKNTPNDAVISSYIPIFISQVSCAQPLAGTQSNIRRGSVIVRLMREDVVQNDGGLESYFALDS
jgi:hypothetical protein